VQEAFGYLLHKGVRSVPGLYRSGSVLVVPLKDDKQRVVNMQRIWQDSEGVWQKRYQKNATRVGTYFAIKASPDTVAICEGVATGISIHEATGWTVLAAGDTTQLVAVAKMARRMMPGARIILCADDDRMTEGNPGVTKAREAAEAVRGEVRVPVFDDLDSRGTDFNDLHQEQGLSEVKLQLEARVEPVDDVPLPEEAPYYEEKLGKEKPAGEEAWVPDGYEFTNTGAVIRLPPAKSEKPPTLVSSQPLWVAGVRVDAVEGTKSMVVKWCTPRAGEFGRFDKPHQRHTAECSQHRWVGKPRFPGRLDMCERGGALPAQERVAVPRHDGASSAGDGGKRDGLAWGARLDCPQLLDRREAGRRGLPDVREPQP
jgi:hypothetical protein